MVKRYLLLLLLPAFTFAQEMQQDQANWFAYMGTYNSSPKWGYSIEAQFRLNGELSRNNQNVFRLGAFYHLNKKVTLAAGYGLLNSIDLFLDNYFHEDRIWEQFQYKHLWNNQKNILTARYRLEQRFVDQLGVLEDGSIGKTTTNYQNRFRYLNKNTFHLANFKSGNEELYFVVQDEVFLNLGNNKVNDTFFDQNRFNIGIGFNYKNSIQFEITYMNQFLNLAATSDRMNHVVSLTLFQNLILYREK